LAEQGRQLDLVLAFHVSQDELQRRLLGRASQERREDDAPDTIGHRLNVYAQQTAPLVDYYRRRSILADIDASGSPDEVFQRVRLAVDTSRQNT
jgi:adenylate kinase